MSFVATEAMLEQLGVAAGVFAGTDLVWASPGFAERFEAMAGEDREMLLSVLGGGQGSAFRFPGSGVRARIHGPHCGGVLVELTEDEHPAAREMGGLYELLGAFIEPLPFGVVLIDPERRIVTCNRRFAELGGAGTDALIGRVLPPKLRSRTLAGEEMGDREHPFERALAGEVVHGAELRETLAGGEERIVRVDAVPCPLPDGGTGVFATVTDISAEEVQREEVRQAGQRWYTILDHLSVGTALIDEQGVIVAANRAMAEHAGPDEEALVGRVVGAPWPVTWLDGTPVRRDENPVYRVITGEHVEPTELREQRPGRGEMYSRVSASECVLPDGRRGVVVVHQDITAEVTQRIELQRAAARNQALFEHLPDAVLVVRSGGELVASNEKAAEVMEEEYPGRSLGGILQSVRAGEWELENPGETLESRWPLESILSGRSAGRVRLQRRGGGRTFEADAAAFPLENGELGAVVTFRDVTGEAALEREHQVLLERFRNTVENLEQAVSIYRPEIGGGGVVDLHTVYLNPTAERFRSDPGPWTGRRCSEYITDFPEFLELCRRAWHGEVVRYTLGSLEAGPHPGMTPLVAELTLLRSGEEIIAVGTDTSAQQTTMATIRRSAEFLGEVFETIGEGVVVRNESGEVVVSNAVAKEYLGEAGDGMGSGWESYDVSGSSTSPGTHPGMLTLRTGEECENVMLELRRRGDGASRWVSVNTRNTVLPTGERGVVTSFADITVVLEAAREVEESRERYRRVFSEAGDGLLTVTVRGEEREVEMNRAAVEILGLDSVPESWAEAVAVRPVIHDERGRAVSLTHGPIQRLLDGERVAEEAYQLQRGRERRWISVSGTRHEMGDGRVVAAIWITDTTEERAREAVLVAAGTQLAAANDELRELFRRLAEAGAQERADVARELHDGPVQTLVALRWTLATRDPESAEGCEMVIDQLRSMILDLRPPTLDQDGLGAAAADLLERASTVPHRLEYEELDEGALTPACRDLAWRVVREAVRNAVRHGGESMTEIAVTLRSAGGDLEVEVIDDGDGLEPGAVTAAPRDGHYGLYLLRQGVEAAGGTLELRNGAPGGAVLSARIPCRS